MNVVVTIDDTDGINDFKGPVNGYIHSHQSPDMERVQHTQRSYQIPRLNFPWKASGFLSPLTIKLLFQDLRSISHALYSPYHVSPTLPLRW